MNEKNEMKKKSNSKLIILLLVSVLLIGSGVFMYLKKDAAPLSDEPKEEPIKCVDENLVYNLDGLELQNITEGGYNVGIGEFEFDLVNTSSETIAGGYIKIIPNCSVEKPIFIKYNDLLPDGRQHYLAQYTLEATSHSVKYGLAHLTDDELMEQEKLNSE